MISKTAQGFIAGAGLLLTIVGLVLLQSASSADEELRGGAFSFSDCQIGWLAEATNTNVTGIDTSNCGNLRSQREFGNSVGPLLLGLGIAVMVSPIFLRRIKSKSVACKWCAEKVLIEAKVCKHCGKELRD